MAARSLYDADAASGAPRLRGLLLDGRDGGCVAGLAAALEAPARPPGPAGGGAGGGGGAGEGDDAAGAGESSGGGAEVAQRARAVGDQLRVYDVVYFGREARVLGAKAAGLERKGCFGWDPWLPLVRGLGWAPRGRAF